MRKCQSGSHLLLSRRPFLPKAWGFCLSVLDNGYGTTYTNCNRATRPSVSRTRSKPSPRRPGGVIGALKTIESEEGFSALWAGTTPRVARSVLSGAIQFGSYEFVKGLFGVEPRKL